MSRPPLPKSREAHMVQSDQTVSQAPPFARAVGILITGLIPPPSPQRLLLARSTAHPLASLSRGLERKLSICRYPKTSNWVRRRIWCCALAQAMRLNTVQYSGVDTQI